MGAPTTTVRSAPVGVFLEDGYSTKIAFNSDPDVSLWEKTVTPIGLDAGDAIDTTTMHNVTWRTMATRSLITATGGSAVVAYDPVVIDQIIALLGVNDDITIHFPNGDTLDFWGFLQSFTPQEHSEGSQPEANIVITPTNTDPSDGSEAAPNYKTSTGTD